MNRLFSFILHIAALIILTVLILHCLFIIATTDIIFSFEHYTGIAIVCVGWLALIFNQVWSHLIVTIGLLISTFTIAAYTPEISYYRLGFSINNFGFDVKIQFYCLLLLILHISFNYKPLKMIFSKGSVSTRT
jgi:hypothetical protein